MPDERDPDTYARLQLLPHEYETVEAECQDSTKHQIRMACMLILVGWMCGSLHALSWTSWTIFFCWLVGMPCIILILEIKFHRWFRG